MGIDSPVGPASPRLFIFYCPWVRARAQSAAVNSGTSGSHPGYLVVAVMMIVLGLTPVLLLVHPLPRVESVFSLNRDALS